MKNAHILIFISQASRGTQILNQKKKSSRESRRDGKYFSESLKYAENKSNEWALEWWFKFTKSY